MGNTSSSNATDSLIDTMIKVNVQTVQDCSNRIHQTQKIDINNCSHVTITGVKMKQLIDMKAFDCLSTADVQQKLANQAQIEAEQTAKAVTENMSIGNTEADNYTKSVMKLATEVNNSFRQDCRQNVEQEQRITCKNSDDVTVRMIEFDQVQKLAKKCIMSNKNVTDAKTQADAHFKQDADAKASFSPFGFAGIALLLLIGLAIVFFGNKVLNWKFLLAIVAVLAVGVAVYFLVIKKK